MKFKGDIIITDPCYIIKEINSEDWDKCDFGDNMEVLGINHYISESTIYGDWSCTTFDMDSKKPLGEFCADSGMVGVFSLEEVLKYNPDFDYHISRPWTTTLIKGFDGTVTIKKEKDEVYVKGLGNINFTTKQTGF